MFLLWIVYVQNLLLNGIDSCTEGLIDSQGIIYTYSIKIVGLIKFQIAGI